MRVKKWHCAECKRLKRNIQPGDVVVCTQSWPPLKEGQLYEVVHTSASILWPEKINYVVVRSAKGLLVGGEHAEWDSTRFEVVGDVR